MTLRQIQIQLTEEYGESHFHADEQPLRYAQVLLLTGQYEAATAFLSRAAGGQLRPHAVHFALAVHALGLLALPSDPIQAPLLSAEVSQVLCFYWPHTSTELTWIKGSSLVRSFEAHNSRFKLEA